MKLLPAFTVLRSKDDQLYFNLVALNGEIIGTSEMYTVKQSVDIGIVSIMDNAPDALIVDTTLQRFGKHPAAEKKTPRFEIRRTWIPNPKPRRYINKAWVTKVNDEVARYYFVLIAANGEIILTGELYTQKWDAHRGIKSVKRCAPYAVKVDRSAVAHG